MKPLGVCCGRSFYDRTEWHKHQLKHRQQKSGTEPLTTQRRKNEMSTQTLPKPAVSVAGNSYKAQGDMFVIETDDNIYLGFVEEIPAQSEDEVDLIKVRTGFQGHPFVLQKVDIDSITPATNHPYVEWL